MAAFSKEELEMLAEMFSPAPSRTRDDGDRGTRDDGGRFISSLFKRRKKKLLYELAGINTQEGEVQ